MNDESTSGDERKAYCILLKPLCEIFGNLRHCPIKSILAGKCLILLSTNVDDQKNKLVMIQYNILNAISTHLTSFDEQLIICSLDLLVSLLPATKQRIGEYLYTNPKYQIINRLFKLLRRPEISGAYHSARVILLRRCL